MSEHNDYANMNGFGSVKMRDLIAQKESRALQELEKKTFQNTSRKNSQDVGQRQKPNSRMTGDFGPQL